jgi:hypothetical protein
LFAEERILKMKASQNSARSGSPRRRRLWPRRSRHWCA